MIELVKKIKSAGIRAGVIPLLFEAALEPGRLSEGDQEQPWRDVDDRLFLTGL